MPESTTPEGANQDFGRAQRLHTLQEMPVDVVRSLEGRHSQVAVSIKRRNLKGQLASLGYNGILMSPEELLRIEDWIIPRAGGGAYVIEVRNPADSSKYLVPSFQIVIEGNPTPAVPLSTPVAPGMTAGGPMRAGFPQPAGDAPFIPGVHMLPVRSQMKWAQGLDPQQAAALAQSTQQVQALQAAGFSPWGGYPPAPGATMATDQLATAQLHKAESAEARLAAQLEAERTRAADRERALEAKLAEERERAREQQHALQLKMLENQIAMMVNKPAETKQPGVAEIVAALAPFAPVFAAMVTSGKEASTKTLEVQQAGMSRMLELAVAQQNKPQPDPLQAVERLAPLLLPLLTNALQKPPDDRAAMFAAMTEANMQQMAMMAQVAEAVSQSAPAESPMVEFLKQLAASGLSMAQAYQVDQQRQALMQQQQQPRLQQPAPQPAAAPQTVAYRTIDATPPASSATALVVPVAEVPEVVSAPTLNGLNPAMLDLLPTDFRTSEWKRIIIMLHEMQPAETVGVLFAQHLQHLVAFEMLPAPLEHFEVDPVLIFTEMLKPLPIYLIDASYCETVVQETVAALLELGVLTSPEDEEEEGDVDGGATGEDAKETDETDDSPH